MSTTPLMDSSGVDISYPTRDALYVSTSERTFENDDILPSLPVPPLSQTIEKYLDSVKALVTKDEYKNTVGIAKEFENGIGKELQWKLMEKAKHQRNWLEKWWEDVAYLQQRTTLLPLCSMGGITNMEKIWPYTPNTQIEHAGLYIYYQLCFWKLLRKEMLRPHYSHDAPWTMHQFKRLFNTVRIPGETIDKLECHFHTESEDPSSPTHLLVLHQGHIFVFDAVDESGEILTPPELELQFQRVKDWTKVNGKGPGVCSLTVDDRTTWAQNRQWLLEIHPDNAHHLETIGTSLLAVVLDDTEPTNLDEVINYTLTGDCNNRWADKSGVDVIFSNGVIGMISDHTPFDGLVPIVFGYFAYMSLLESGGVWKGPPGVNRALLPPRRLDFHIDDHIQSAIKEAQSNYESMVEDTDVSLNVFSQYGKSFIKPYKIHPETYVQLALQYAYFTMHGRLAPTYVTATTRQFYHGRTETLRACFPELVNWVYAMAENKPSNEKLELLHKASEKFKNLMEDCMKNHGCDRHLMGLYMISVEEELPVPEIFTDSSWTKSGGSGNFVLSTSCCGYTPLGGGVMPMVEDGYGTFYSIENNRITFFISAFNRCTETSSLKFFQHIERALLNMEQLLTTSKL